MFSNWLGISTDQFKLGYMHSTFLRIVLTLLKMALIQFILYEVEGVLGSWGSKGIKNDSPQTYNDNLPVVKNNWVGWFQIGPKTF